MEHIHRFHDWICIFVFSISLLRFSLIIIIWKESNTYRYLNESQTLETMWTFLPSVMLAAVVLPSLRLLYLVDEGGTLGVSIKAVGHQWYWQYDYPDAQYDSYLKRWEVYRLLQSDHRLFTNNGYRTQLIVTAADVLHSWTVPTLGVKADAVPGRVNKLFLRPKRAGVYHGQCSEICGRNHSFMPICLECCFDLIYYTECNK